MHKLYVFKEATTDEDTDTIIPFGAMYVIGAESEEEARKDLPDISKGYFWHLHLVK